jgi:hypothetical protein
MITQLLCGYWWYNDWMGPCPLSFLLRPDCLCIDIMLRTSPTILRLIAGYFARPLHYSVVIGWIVDWMGLVPRSFLLCLDCCCIDVLCRTCMISELNVGTNILHHSHSHPNPYHKNLTLTHSNNHSPVTIPNTIIRCSRSIPNTLIHFLPLY